MKIIHLFIVFVIGCGMLQPPKSSKRTSVPAEGEYAVLRVVDGDTVDIGVPLADGTLLRQRVRLLAVYCPERGEDRYAEAKADLERLAGNRVRLTYDGKRKRGYYGRLLGNIWQPDDTQKSINQQMRDLGWTNFGRGGKKR